MRKGRHAVAVIATLACLLSVTTVLAQPSFVGVSAGQTYTYKISWEHSGEPSDSATQTVTITNVSSVSPSMAMVYYKTTYTGDSAMSTWLPFAQGNGSISVASGTSLPASVTQSQALPYPSSIISTDVANKSFISIYNNQPYDSSNFTVQWASNGMLSSIVDKWVYYDTGDWLLVTITQTTSPSSAAGLAAIAIIIVVVLLVAVLVTRRRHGQGITGRNQPPPPPAPMAGPRFCPSCGSQVSAGKKFCASCGRQL